MHTLYPCKESWASYVINRYFTTGIQSTQHTEVSNKIIKDRLDQNSRLIDVIKEIQLTFDKQSRKALINEYKNEIPIRGLSNIMEEYFPELNKLLREYLTSQIFQKQRDQMIQSLCYNV